MCRTLTHEVTMVTYVVSSIRVVIYTAEEGSCRVLAQVFREEVPAARMLVHEIR